MYSTFFFINLTTMSGFFDIVAGLFGYRKNSQRHGSDPGHLGKDDGNRKNTGNNTQDDSKKLTFSIFLFSTPDSWTKRVASIQEDQLGGLEWTNQELEQKITKTIALEIFLFNKNSLDTPKHYSNFIEIQFEGSKFLLLLFDFDKDRAYQIYTVLIFNQKDGSLKFRFYGSDKTIRENMKASLELIGDSEIKESLDKAIRRRLDPPVLESYPIDNESVLRKIKEGDYQLDI